MVDKLLYQLRVDLDELCAKEFHKNKDIKICPNLVKEIKNQSAELICQYDAFKLFVEECKKENLTHLPLFKWTKDTIENKYKKKKYMKSFTIYVKGEQLYEKHIADRIEKIIYKNKCSCIVKVNKYDSDPKNNPQPPKKYL